MRNTISESKQRYKLVPAPKTIYVQNQSNKVKCICKTNISENFNNAANTSITAFNKLIKTLPN